MKHCEYCKGELVSKIYKNNRAEAPAEYKKRRFCSKRCATGKQFTIVERKPKTLEEYRAEWRKKKEMAAYSLF